MSRAARRRRTTTRTSPEPVRVPATLPRPGPRRRTVVGPLLVTLVVFLLAYVGAAAYRAKPLYDSLKARERGWSGRPHAPDARLGFAPVPDGRGAHVFPIGPDVPMRYDARGLRVPVDAAEPAAVAHPLLLTIGCSFTYGDAVRAEDAWPFVAAQMLGGSAANAGGCGYGLAQMLLLAERLAPSVAPDYLIVQYSPWLAARSQSAFAPSRYGYAPTPYFFDQDGTPRVQDPVFRTIVPELGVDPYRASPRSLGDFLSFVGAVALPLYVHDDLAMLRYRAALLRGALPTEPVPAARIEEHVYRAIARIAAAARARLVIVVLGDHAAPVPVPPLLAETGALVVDAHSRLLAHLPEPSQRAWQISYEHWRGNPPRLVDVHPNPAAHRLIAQAVADAIRADGAGR